MDSYFERIGEHRYRPTSWTSGAWSVEEQHIAPMIGLIVHAIDTFVAARPADGLVLGRISLDILGVIRLEEFEISVDVVRPGRTIELLEAAVTWAGRTVVRARAWRMSSVDTSEVAGGAPDPLPAPDTCAETNMMSVWPGDFIRSLHVRPVTDPQPGRATAWITSDLSLVAGEEVSAVARFVSLVDTANGIAMRKPPDEWMFPNLDLTIHLHRQPRGRWTGLDTTVIFGPAGQGLTSTVLHDETGPVGRAEQILTVRPLR